jgi:hypothetical protein
MSYIEQILEEINDNAMKLDMWDNLIVDTDELGKIIAKHIIYSQMDKNISLDAEEYLKDEDKKDLNLID